MSKQVRYTCTYCGVQNTDKALTPWQMKDKKCAKCGSSKFKAKPLDLKHGNVYGYEDDKKEVDKSELFSYFED